MEVNPDYALWQTLGALCVGLGLSKGMELVANNQTWACKRNPFVSQLKQWPAEWLEKNFRCLLDDFMTTYQLLQMKDDEVVSSYHAKGCFLNENLSALGYLHPNCRALASLFGVVPCFIRGFRRSLDNKKSRKLCCVVKRCRVSFGKSKPPGPGNDLQRFPFRWPVHGVGPGWCLMLNFGHRGGGKSWILIHRVPDVKTYIQNPQCFRRKCYTCT